MVDMRRVYVDASNDLGVTQPMSSGFSIRMSNIDAVAQN
jgi:hypothetical protein